MKRLARAVVLALVTVVALTGCIRYNVDMTLAQDNTASGTIVIAVQKGVGQQMGVGSDQEALVQLFGESPFGPNFTPKDYADGDWVGKSYAFSAVPITDLADLASLFTVTRDGDVFSVDGPGAPVTADEKKQLPPGAESNLSITFPGEVIESNGTVKGTTVSWNLFAMTGPVHATAKATVPGSGSWLPTWVLIAGGAALVALIGAAVTVLLVRRRRNPVTPVGPEPIDWEIPAAALPTKAPTESAVDQPAPAPSAVEQPAPAPSAVDQPAPAPSAAAPKKSSRPARKPRVAPEPDPDAEGDGKE
ncbi:LppM family (lipo)protein [Demequina lutea]|uniref:LppM domain-containing protein n=1 Tax=Demequina lutea TaxID=431489 RepID=A0A7Y9Z9F0_9MICO|nr:hypothetical protein [Demequina lutea]NYI40073.1 hypothetical protein [Demequina lutea]